MVSMLNYRSSDQGSNTGRVHCIVFLSRHFTLPLPPSLHIYKWILRLAILMLGSSPKMHLASLPGLYIRAITRNTCRG